MALNCVANGKLLKENLFDDIWIQPASGDAGSSLGAALLIWHEYLQNPRNPNPNDSMKGTYLGCEFTNKEIISYLNQINAPFQELNDEELISEAAILQKKLKLTQFEVGFMLPFWVAAKNAKNKILMCGQGADEVFGGYARFRESMKNANLDKETKVSREVFGSEY